MDSSLARLDCHPVQLLHRSLSPCTHSLALLFTEHLLWTSSYCRHWGYSMSKTDQPLPSWSCSLQQRERSARGSG